MKKTVAVICFISIFFLTACSGGKGKEKITVAEAGYTCDAVIEYGENFSSSATIKAVGGGIFSLAINRPENVSGLTFLFDTNEMMVAYNGIDVKNNLPSGYGGFAEILNEIFLKFTTSTPPVSYENGEYVYEGENPRYSFRVVFNKQGFPLKITVEAEALKATFSNWRY